VIGFGLAGVDDADVASLRSIAEASGGRFLTATSAAELRKALSTTVGTPYLVWSGEEPVARGTLGSGEVIPLAAGHYRVQLASAPPQEISVELESEIRHTVSFERSAEGVSHTQWRDVAEYKACEAPVSIAGETTRRHTASPAAPHPAAPRPAAPEPGDPTEENAPKARRWETIDIEGGRIEIWQNLRPQRTAEWGVVVRHSSAENGSAMIWAGDDLEAAWKRVRDVRDRLARDGTIEAPAP
jgi:hypothetical protein